MPSNALEAELALGLTADQKLQELIEDTSEAAKSDVYGLLSIGGIEVALPLATLREVVPCPSEYQPMPVKAPGFLGAMELRGCIVPVIDVTALIGGAVESRENSIIVVMTNGKHIVGLVGDQLRSVQHVPETELISVEVSSGSLLFEMSFLHPEARTVVSVLSIGAVLALPGIPLIADVTNRVIAKTGTTSVGAGQSAGKYTFVTAGEYTLAFDIAQVHTTLPNHITKPSMIKSDLCLGVSSYSGYDVPVIDPLVLLGLGRLPEGAEGPGLVLKFETGFVILALSSLVELRELFTEDISPLPPFAVKRPDAFAGMSEVVNGLALLLDGDALMHEPELLSHAAVNTITDENESVETADAVVKLAGSQNAQSQLTFSIGIDVAAPLEQIEEILPIPETTTNTYADSDVLGVVAHRDGVVPIVCLASILGRSRIEPTSKSCLLLIDNQGTKIALAVDGLKAIDNIAWSDPDTKPADLTSPAELPKALQKAQLIQVAGDSTLIPQIDLKQIVRLIDDPSIEALA